MKIRMLVTRRPHLSGEEYDLPEAAAKRYLHFREAELVETAAVRAPETATARRSAPARVPTKRVTKKRG